MELDRRCYRAMHNVLNLRMWAFQIKIDELQNCSGWLRNSGRCGWVCGRTKVITFPGPMWTQHFGSLRYKITYSTLDGENKWWCFNSDRYKPTFYCSIDKETSCKVPECGLFVYHLSVCLFLKRTRVKTAVVSILQNVDWETEKIMGRMSSVGLYWFLLFHSLVLSQSYDHEHTRHHLVVRVGVCVNGKDNEPAGGGCKTAWLEDQVNLLH